MSYLSTGRASLKEAVDWRHGFRGEGRGWVLLPSWFPPPASIFTSKV